MRIAPRGRTIPDVTHHLISVDGAELHFVAAGNTGSPILLVHGFPETWWTFHKIIPLLAKKHRVYAVDLRGFGDSSNGPGDYDSSASTEDLHHLIRHLDVGAVHLAGQDISGATVFRVATSHPDDVSSLTAIEMGLPGFGLEALADVTKGGAWHIGVLAAPGIPEMLLAGREHAFLEDGFRSMSVTPAAITDADIDEFVRSYSRADGWRGATGLYRSMLREGAEIQKIARAGGLKMPVLAIGAGGASFTVDTMSQVAATDVRSVLMDGVGHYAALEAPVAIANAILDFTEGVDASRQM